MINEEYRRRFVYEVTKCMPNMVYVQLEDETLDRIDDFVNRIVPQKFLEKQHQADDENEYTRFFTGMMGECAMEKLFHRQFVDWTIGNSRLYQRADLRKLGLRVGIKTVEMYKFPVVFKTEWYPELICIRRNVNTIILCGLATVPVLRKYQDVNLILSPKLKKKGTKTGFYGFEHLIKISSFDDLKRFR